MQKQTQRLCLLLGVVVIAAFNLAVNAADQATVEEVETLRTNLKKWLETRQLISQEEKKWKEQKQLLQDRVDLMKSQITKIEDKIEKAKKDLESTQEKKEKLQKERDTVQASLSVFENSVEGMEVSTLRLVKQLPSPVKKKVEMFSQEIPEKGEDTPLSIANRYINMMGIMNEVNKFAKNVKVTTEVREMDGKESVEVKVIYFGLGAAYFCNQDGSIGGMGHPTVDGWKWERRDEIAPLVASQIARYRNEKPAQYDALPVKVTNTTGTAEQ
jgi:gas vesicle protein